MRTAYQIAETILVLISGLIAFFYGLARYTADVFLTTGSRVIDIWSRE